MKALACFGIKADGPVEFLVSPVTPLPQAIVEVTKLRTSRVLPAGFTKAEVWDSEAGRLFTIYPLPVQVQAKTTKKTKAL